MFDGFQESSIEVGPGVSLHVRTAGTGPPVVLLHGYPQSGLCWHRVAPGARRVAHRRRARPARLRPLEHAARRRRPHRLLQAPDGRRRRRRDGALGHERFAVVGHDRGGRVAYRTALDHPDRVDRLCTLDIIPTIEQFELLASNRRAAVGGFHWYFLAFPPPLPEALIGAEPQLYLEQVMGRWAGRRRGRRVDHPRGDGGVRPRLHAGRDRRVVRRLPGRRDVRQRPRRRRPRRRAHDRLPGPRAVGRPPQRRRQRRRPRRRGGAGRPPTSRSPGGRCRAATSSPRSAPTCASRSCARSSPDRCDAPGRPMRRHDGRR